MRPPACTTALALLALDLMALGQEPAHTTRITVDPALAAHADATKVVATLADAAEWLRAHPDPAQDIQIRLTPGEHACREGATIRGPFRRLSVEPMQGHATLLGGLQIAQPDWQPCAPEVATELPEISRGAVRTLQLPATLMSKFGSGL
mgnify:CR=1 FL=1